VTSPSGPVLAAFAHHYLADRGGGPLAVLHLAAPSTGDLPDVLAPHQPEIDRLEPPPPAWRNLLRGRRLDLPRRAYDVAVVDPAALDADPLPQLLLAALRRVLRDDGILLVLPAARRELRDSAISAVPERSDPGSLVGAVVWAGFVLVEVSSSALVDGPVIVARPVARRGRQGLRSVATAISTRLRHATTARALQAPVPAGAGLADARGGPAGRPSPPLPHGGAGGGPAPFERAGEVWDQHAAAAASGDPTDVQRAEWQAHPHAQRYLTDRAGASFPDWLAARLPDGPRRAVSIGSGRSVNELDLVERGVLDAVELFDISAGSLAIAAADAERRGIADRVTVHQAAFDPDLLGTRPTVVMFLDSLHHIEALEGVLGSVAELLGDRGVLVGREYVGPARFAFPDDHLAHAQALYRILDPGLCGPSADLQVPHPDEVRAVDPTEAVRSDEIVGELRRRFTDVEVCPIGGGLVFPLWFGLDHDTMFDTPTGNEAVAWILDHDARLTDSGELPPYFVYLAARGTPA
jgi:SAM-dependent methyltransferase